MLNPWICCQLGAREHYAIPRALYHQEKLHTLFTDIWVKSNHFSRHLPGNFLQPLRDRYHSDLDNANIKHCFLKSLFFEFEQKINELSGWDLILKRNECFQSYVVNQISTNKYFQKLSPKPILFSYSYAALEIFQFAKKLGWTLVLGQIDPGICEMQIIQEEYDRHPNLIKLHYSNPPSFYWENWKEECKLADHIIVNSTWSYDLLREAGISPSKIKIVPLVYTHSAEALSFKRIYPQSFSGSRPLKVLFLGQVCLRKGIAAILDTIPLLKNLPIELTIVGSQQITIPDFYRNHPQIFWVGQVPRSQAQSFYQSSDIFLFPTLSDGYGLTQLEAQSWQLPIIASPYCGNVIEHNHNGILLPEVTGQYIADALVQCLESPQLLQHFSQNANIGISIFELYRSLQHFHNN